MRLKMTVAYDGTDFSGFQSQPRCRTVQDTLEEVLSRVADHPVQVTASGRTDAGVHAQGQVIHWDTDSPLPVDRWVRVTNHILPKDVLIRSAEEVKADFHARKDARWKWYRYTWDTRRVPDLFLRRYTTHWPHSLDVNAMAEAGRHLVGTHDFTSFSAARAQVSHRVRSLYECRIRCPQHGVVALDVVGDGFLYNMVRIIAGTLADVGGGKIAADSIPAILEARKREAAGRTLPPEGLTLMRVGYGSDQERNFLS
ncbi:tRNA pseudouridine(38-40) synthase TruA [Desmospora profundinema]|uniref:tRNA pseudouridine synthase A n=1 Tax=Desmospora profundinema TaxID=1571184 RepID=A0ABU1IQ54_9BACL|nr:tRNA pseudouridine(38-40) synthase TruA [Desmospora profundinema]MDR6226924.1 tRNA pseudouridine38-40 synthase [Desmospora profundinema]